MKITHYSLKACFRMGGPGPKMRGLSGPNIRLAVKVELEEWQHLLEGAQSPFLVWT